MIAAGMWTIVVFALAAWFLVAVLFLALLVAACKIEDVREDRRRARGA